MFFAYIPSPATVSSVSLSKGQKKTEENQIKFKLSKFSDGGPAAA